MSSYPPRSELIRYEPVGLPCPSGEIKLLDAMVADGTSRTEHRPKGGVCIRGPSESVLNGLLLKIHKYFDRPQDGGSFPISTCPLNCGPCQQTSSYGRHLPGKFSTLSTMHIPLSPKITQQLTDSLYHRQH